MPEYKPNQEIIEQSFRELGYIMKWVKSREDNQENPITVLVGGWAVYAYNPWYGSIDIDLITNNRTKERLKHHLRTRRGYIPYRTAEESTVCKPTESGSIIIDFGTRERPYRFEGRTEALDLEILNGNTVIKKIGEDISAAVPTRSLLFLFKLKAAWDREYRVKTRTSEDISWESGKLIKDYADLLALIDPEYGGEDIDIAFLGEQFKRFEFLRECLRGVPDNDDARTKYGKMDRETAQKTWNKLLELLK